MKVSSFFQWTVSLVMAVVCGLSMTSMVQAAGVPHDAAFKALGQRDYQTRAFRSYNSYNYGYSTAAPAEQRSYSVAPEATTAVPAPPAAAQVVPKRQSAPPCVQSVPAPQVQQERRSYSYQPQPVTQQPVYQPRSYNSYRWNAPAYTLPRAMRH